MLLITAFPASPNARNTNKYNGFSMFLGAGNDPSRGSKGGLWAWYIWSHFSHCEKSLNITFAAVRGVCERWHVANTAYSGRSCNEWARRCKGVIHFVLCSALCFAVCSVRCALFCHRVCWKWCNVYCVWYTGGRPKAARCGSSIIVKQ